MDMNTREFKYNCITRLLFNINDLTKDEFFKNMSDKYPSTYMFDYDDIYLYISTILLNNRPFFKCNFEEMPWEIDFSDFRIETSINKRTISDYEEPNKRIQKEKERISNELIGLYDDIYTYKSYMSKDYKEYIYEKNKVQNISDKEYKKRYGLYNPDVYDQMKYDDYLFDTYLSEQKLSKKELEFAEIEKARYKKILATIGPYLKDVNGNIDINKVLKKIRNGLAHFHWKITEGETIELIFYKDEDNKVVQFSCEITDIDMLMILREYIYNIFKEYKNNYSYLSQIYLNNNYYYVLEDTYKVLKENLFNDIKQIEYFKDFEDKVTIMEKRLKNDPYSDDIYFQKNLIELTQNYFEGKYEIISGEYKINQFKYILDLINDNCNMYHEIYNEHNNTLVDYNYFTKGSIIDGTYLMLNSMANNNLLSEKEGRLSAYLNVLFNILFVQTDYKDIDLSCLDLTELRLSSSYIKDKQDKLDEKIKQRDKAINNISLRMSQIENSINSGKVPNKNLLISEYYKLQSKLDNHEKNRINEINEFISFYNKGTTLKFNHIRNAFAHGNATFEFPRNGNLDDINVIIKDYDKNDKLTFDGSIKLKELLKEMLKDDLMFQIRYGSLDKIKTFK